MSKQGYVKRKNTTSVMGRHTWSSKYLVLAPGADEVKVFASHEAVTKQTDSIALADIASAAILPKKKGRRFNVALEGGGVVALLAETPEEAQAWVAAVTEAHAAAKAARDEERRRQQQQQQEEEEKKKRAEEDDGSGEEYVVVDVDADEPAAPAPLSGEMVRLNAPAANSASAVSLVSAASAVSEETFQSMRRVFFSLGGGRLTLYADSAGEKPVGFVDPANIERVETFAVPPQTDSADNDILEAPNRDEGVRLFLGEEHEVWELAVPETGDHTAADWVQGLSAAREAALKERAGDRAGAGAGAGDDAGGDDAGNGAGANQKRRGSTKGDYQDVDLDADEADGGGKAGGSEEDAQEDDLKEEKQKKKCACVVM